MLNNTNNRIKQKQYLSSFSKKKNGTNKTLWHLFNKIKMYFISMTNNSLNKKSLTQQTFASHSTSLPDYALAHVLTSQSPEKKSYFGMQDY